MVPLSQAGVTPLGPQNIKRLYVLSWRYLCMLCFAGHAMRAVLCVLRTQVLAAAVGAPQHAFPVVAPKLRQVLQPGQLDGGSLRRPCSARSTGVMYLYPVSFRFSHLPCSEFRSPAGQGGASARRAQCSQGSGGTWAKGRLNTVGRRGK